MEDLPRERGCRWYVGCIKSRMEKRFAWELRAEKVSYYLPMAEKTSRANGRMMESMQLLFPGYIFLLMNIEDFWRSKQNRRMWSLFTPDAGGQKFLREDLQSLIRAAREVRLEAVRLEQFTPGKLVKIVEGHSLAGLLGRVDLRNNRRIFLTPRAGEGMFFGAASFEIDAKYLNVVEE